MMPPKAELKSDDPEIENVQKNIGFWFRFSENPANTTDYEKNINVEILNSNLPKIDNSVESVERLYSEKNVPTNTYTIKFKNGDQLTVSNGDLEECKKRLSHGTFEAIDFILMLDARFISTNCWRIQIPNLKHTSSETLSFQSQRNHRYFSQHTIFKFWH